MRINLLKKIVYPAAIVVLFFVVLELFLHLVGFSGRADDTRFVLNPEWDYPEFFEKDQHSGGCGQEQPFYNASQIHVAPASFKCVCPARCIK